MTSSWPFSTWGIDAILMIHLEASNEHRYILVAKNYFTKWMEAVSSANLTKTQVKQNITGRYGLHQSIIMDKPRNLNNDIMDSLCGQFKIHHQNLTSYKLKMNRVVEDVNKNNQQDPLEKNQDLLSQCTEAY